MSSANGLLFTPPLGGLLPSPCAWETGFLVVPHHTRTGTARPAWGHQPCGCPLFVSAPLVSKGLPDVPSWQFPLNAVLPAGSSAESQWPCLQGAKCCRKLRVRSEKQGVVFPGWKSRPKLGMHQINHQSSHPA